MMAKKTRPTYKYETPFETKIDEPVNSLDTRLDTLMQKLETAIDEAIAKLQRMV